MAYLLVFVGGGLGAMFRHFINTLSGRLLGTAFPYHTFFINVTGSIVMGLIAGYLAFKGGSSQHFRLFLMTGILGGYTTFSAFSLDAALLWVFINKTFTGFTPYATLQVSYLFLQIEDLFIFQRQGLLIRGF